MCAEQIKIQLYLTVEHSEVSSCTYLCDDVCKEEKATVNKEDCGAE